MILFLYFYYYYYYYYYFIFIKASSDLPLLGKAKPEATQDFVNKQNLVDLRADMSSPGANFIPIIFGTTILP